MPSDDSFAAYLQSTTDGSAGGTFATNAPAPYVTGITKNVLGGSVNIGHDTRSVDTELLAYKGKSKAGTEDVYTSASVQAAAQALYGLSNAEVADLQRRLVAGGYMKSTDVVSPGLVDTATAKAYGDLLQDTSAYNAAGNNKTVDEQLADRTKVAVPDPSTNPSTLNVIQLANPASLREAAHNAFKEATGRGRAANDKVVEKFVASFQRQQIAAQRAPAAAAQATRTTPGAHEVTVTTPDAGAQAAEFARAQAPAEAGAHDVTKQFDTFLGLLKGIV